MGTFKSMPHFFANIGPVSLPLCVLPSQKNQDRVDKSLCPLREELSSAPASFGKNHTVAGDRPTQAPEEPRKPLDHLFSDKGRDFKVFFV